MLRFIYYFKKAILLFREKGIEALFFELSSFLLRRKLGFSFVLEWVEFVVFSRFRSIDQTLLRFVGGGPIDSEKILIYASFDPASKISASVVEQIRFFSESGYSVIFVSTSPDFTGEEFSKIQPWVQIAAHRLNLGYDFASFRLGYSLLISHLAPGTQLKSVVLMNDSCVGPDFDFSPQLRMMQEANSAVFGISISNEMGAFIQSYFYHFGAGTLACGLLDKVMRRVRILNSKWAIVRFFEIGTSRLLMEEGVPLYALIDSRLPAIAAKLREFGVSEPMKDPAGTYWKSQGVCPFYKRSNLKVSA